MLTIRCTKKLLDELKLKPYENPEEKPFFSWHANLLTIYRRKAVLLINDKARYPVLLFGLKAPNFKQFDKIITDAIEATFLAEGISPEIVDKYMKEAGQISFARTSDRSLISAMNQIAMLAGDCDPEELDMDNLIQTDFSLRMGDWLFKVDGDYKHPKEMLLDAMTQFARGDAGVEVEQVVSIKAHQFLMALDLENHKVWRRVIVPADITFMKFHNVIQDAFGWRNCHLYEFTILESENPVARIVCDKEAMEYKDDTECPIEEDGKTKLTKYLPTYDQIGYVYDFGDDWVHYIELEKSIDDYDKNYPTCVDGEGNCPPEDVGGEGGYEAFLEAIGDPKNPEHEEMFEWAKMQYYRDFDIKRVNIDLKHSLRRR